jgi:hypothetical protein
LGNSVKSLISNLYDCRIYLARPTGVFALLLDELGDQAGPAGLMAGAHASAVVTVEILVERHIITLVLVVLEALLPAEHRPPPTPIARRS